MYLTVATRNMWLYELLTWIYNYDNQVEHSHGGRYDYAHAFDTNPDLIQPTHYTLWYPTYYYYKEKKFNRTKYQTYHWIKLHQV